MSTMVEILRGEAAQASEIKSTHSGETCGLYEGFCEEMGECFLKSHIEHQATAFDYGEGRADWTPARWQGFAQEVQQEACDGGCTHVEELQDAIEHNSPSESIIPHVPQISHETRAA